GQEVLANGWEGRLKQLAEEFDTERRTRHNGVLELEKYLHWRFNEALRNICGWITDGELAAKEKGIPIVANVERRLQEITSSFENKDDKYRPVLASVEVFWPDFVRCRATSFRKSNAGRKKQLARQELAILRKETVRLLDHHGGLSPDDPDFN